MTHIVSISVDHGNARKVCELIQAQTYESREKLGEAIESELFRNSEFEFDYSIMTFDDFMDLCNDQLYDVESNFISYVKII